MRILGLIPARGGSKGIPRKNIRQMAGKPLVQYTIEAAQAAKRLSRVIVSTEDDEIAEVSRSLEADVPFMRPAELAADDTSTLQVVLHALDWLEQQGETYDAVCVLEPTNPLRTSNEIDGCIALMQLLDADTVLTVAPVPDRYHPHRVYFKTPQNGLIPCVDEKAIVHRRQDRPEAFYRDGSVYLSMVEVLRRKNSLFGDHIAGYILDGSASISIDTPEDWARAEAFLAGQRVNPQQGG
jgi:CMP-N-acetylneuraminic acid synthetase